MNDFFMHQALKNNSDALDKLNVHLTELKTLTNGDLAKSASDDLSLTREVLVSEFAKICTAFSGMVTSVRLEQETNFERYRSLLKIGWILFGCTLAIDIGALCFIVTRVH